MSETGAPIRIAILAMGGEGGGVLADWIVDLGEHNGQIAQSTSVAGVAQRTGATIYYLELFPVALARQANAAPVLALMPTPGDVDVLLASELMEAGRAVQRGLVTSGRTTLIASTHRVYSIDEKSAMGNGIVDAGVLLGACRAAARRFVGFDMAQVVEREGSVISAVMFGALCASGALPFDRAAFEATIERGGVGVQASLRAFAAGVAGAASAGAPAEHAVPAAAIRPSGPETEALARRLDAEFDADQRPLLLEGVRRLLDYQDPAYAAQYLDRVRGIARLGSAGLTSAVARHLALWMSFEDPIRVADLKIRGSRFDRVRHDVKARADQALSIHEFLHPRLEEICDTLPRRLGLWLAGSGVPRRWVERLARKGRIVRTSSIGGFLLLYGVAALRRWRRSSLRFTLEDRAIAAWLERIERVAPRDPALAIQIAQCQRLVKGYGDTLERGKRHFGRLMAAADRLPGADAAETLRALCDAALADEHGHALQAALARHALD